MVMDPFNLVLLGIVLVVAWKLRAALGSRTGLERTYQPEKKPEAPEAANANVLNFPTEVADPKEPELPVWAGYASEGSALAESITKIAAADANFAPKSFIAGARMAYEMIVEGFAKGDKAALKDLLSGDVYDGFAAAIDERAALGHTLQSRFVGIDKAELAGAELDGRAARVTMKFVSEIISVTLDKAGSVVDGDDKHIRQITDVWTFERDTSSRDPNWKLASTQEQV